MPGQEDFFSCGYSDDCLRIASINSNNSTITVKDPAQYTIFSTSDSSTGAGADSRNQRGFYIYNGLEELDSPGEWYLNKNAGTLHFWPPDNSMNTADIVVSILEDPITVSLETNNLTIQHIHFEYSRGTGLILQNTIRTKIIDSIFENLGTIGISTSVKLSIC